MIRGQVLTHGRSRHSIACPIAAVVHRLTPQTPLLSRRPFHCAPLPGPHHQRLLPHTSSLVIAAIHGAASSTPFGFCPPDVNARALRAGGAVPSQTPNMVGHWRSDAMFRYLYLQALPLMHTLAPLMLQAGSFTLPPGQELPVNAAALLATIPEEDTTILDNFD